MSPVCHLLFANSSQSLESVESLLDDASASDELLVILGIRMFHSIDDILDIQLHLEDATAPVSSNSAGFSAVPSADTVPSSGVLTSALSSAASK